MKKSLLVFILLQSLTSFAQHPKIDLSFRDELIRQKSIHQRNLVLSETEKTLNQNNFDVKYYSLELTPIIDTRILNGIAETRGEVKNEPIDFVELNFWDGMSIIDVYISDKPEIKLNYLQQNDIIKISLDKVYSLGEQFNFTIEYSGKPENSGYRSFNFDWYDNKPMLWTMSSVFRARGWWPCKDLPSDKPDSMDIKVTVPNNLTVVSNGSLRQTILDGDLKTYWWHEKYPIATYLVSLAIYPYEINYDNYFYNNNSDTMQIQFYSFPGNFERFSKINYMVKDMIKIFSNLFGEYPFVDEKYAQADFLWGGGMEHQTCTSYGSWNEALFAHEIAHQWWGDMITCESYHHIWLNEGFASYSEALWFENAYPGYTSSEYQTSYQMYLGEGTVYVEDPENENIFDSGLSYSKGSWILHMLRHIVGENNFVAILRTYYNSTNNQYASATTEEFQLICEEISGLNLDKFFHQWVYQEKFPIYSFEWNSSFNGSNYQINLEITQEQQNHTFWMPIDINVTTENGENKFVVWDSLATQSFTLNVSSQPTKIEIDKDDWILKIINEQIVDPTFDQGILLVNGVSFEIYGSEIYDAYSDNAFWGNYSISFWDCFNTPISGYPSSLPQKLGTGKISADILSKYSTVIWIGNNYSGDLGRWQQAAILQYLKAGGNVILLSRKGQNYFNNELLDYVGINWIEDEFNNINNCESVFAGLKNISFTGEQSYNAVFDTSTLNSNINILFTETTSFSIPRGIGFWFKPINGGDYKNNGGNFIFISGRPYRFNSNDLKSNMEVILHDILNEPISGISVGTQFNLSQNYPNPFNSTTTINYYLPEEANITISIYNLLGQKITTLVNKSESLGNKFIEWDGTDDKGAKISSGVYIYQIRSKNEITRVKSKKLVLLK